MFRLRNKKTIFIFQLHTLNLSPGFRHYESLTFFTTGANQSVHVRRFTKVKNRIQKNCGLPSSFDIIIMTLIVFTCFFFQNQLFRKILSKIPSKCLKFGSRSNLTCCKITNVKIWKLSECKIVIIFFNQSVGPPRGFGDLGRMAIYFQGAGEQALSFGDSGRPAKKF